MTTNGSKTATLALLYLAGYNNAYGNPTNRSVPQVVAQTARPCRQSADHCPDQTVRTGGTTGRRYAPGR